MPMGRFFWTGVLLCGLAVVNGCGGSSSNPGPVQDFSLSSSPQSVFVPSGAGNGTMQVSVQAMNGFSQPVLITLQGLPNGVTSTPASPFSMNPGTQQTVTLSAMAGTSPGVQTITVQGSEATLLHTSTFSLSVAAPVYAYISAGTSSAPPTAIAGYSVDANTGITTAVSGSPFSLADPPIDIATLSTSGGMFVFALTYNSTTQIGTLLSYSVASGSGTLTSLQSISYPQIPGQGHLALHPSGKFLYVALAGNCILAYSIDPATGNLSQSSCSAQSQDGPLVIAPSGNFAYSATGYPPGSLTAYSVSQSDGSLAVIQSVSSDQENSILTTDTQGHALYDVTSAYMPFMCGGLLVWSIDSTTGNISPLTTSFGPPLCTPMAITVSPGNNFAYVSSNLGDTGQSNGIYGGVIDPTTGNLTNVSGSPFAASIDPLLGVVEPSQGKFLIELATKPTTFTLTAFTIDASTGALTQISGTGTSFTPTQPEKMVIVTPQP